jgi:serine/threonine-protein kinase
MPPVPTGPYTIPAPDGPPDTPFPRERFPPGSLLAGRYRVVSTLGKGGMGEVFRADDLTLGQPVALKFLPPHLRADPARLAAFRQEVAAARRVSHPHVCRVHDLSEHGGEPFLSMEFVDGEDLSSLLRRVGRVPGEKGVEVARQLTGALAALHDQGLLHRDLKPANVMLDGRGRVRLTDFGLVAAADAVGDVRSGTPLYMAPEQAAGKEVTARSDLFALGLVLYELFTGKRAFPDARRDSAPSNPSELVPELDPAVGRVIVRCLAADPADRPASAAEVLAGLPGGDPLAEARAAGVTPSPELVAAAGEVGRLAPAVGAALFAAVLVGLVVFLALYDRVMLVGMVGLPESAEELAVRGRDVFRLAGFPARADAVGFDHDQQFLNHRFGPGDPPDWPGRVRRRPAAPIHFWCRQSPDPLKPDLFYPYPGSLEPGRVTWADPAPFVPGMAGVKLDVRGRLLQFLAVPPERDPDPRWPAAAGEPDWGRWFEAAGLDLARFAPADPAWLPPTFADKRYAWRPVAPDPGEYPFRVEAATVENRVVSFQVVAAWTRRDGGEPLQGLGDQGSGISSSFKLFLPVLAVVFVLGPANLRAGRADAAGAVRLGLLVFGLQMAVWALETRHQFAGLAALQLEVRSLVMGLAFALYWACLVAGSYVALEPLVRRWWPEAVVSWTRLLGGRGRDPLVGRDLLVGVLGGVAWTVVAMLGNQVPAWAGEPPPTPWWDWWVPCTRVGGYWAGNFLSNVVYSFRTAFFYNLLFLLVLRQLLRRPWLYGAAYVLVWTVVHARDLGQTGPTVGWAFLALNHLLVLGLLVRFGALAVIVAAFVSNTLWFPVSLDPSAGYAAGGLLALGSVVALAAYGLHTATTGPGRRAAA